MVVVFKVKHWVIGYIENSKILLSQVFSKFQKVALKIECIILFALLICDCSYNIYTYNRTDHFLGRSHSGLDRNFVHADFLDFLMY